MVKYYIISIFIFINIFFGFSQNVQPATNSYWLVYTGDNKINDNFGLHTEIQMRSFFVHESVTTKLFRIGLHKYIQPNAMITAGYGYFYNTPTESYLDASESREHRIWQQLITRQKSKVIFLEHRYRLEQRFIENLTTNNNQTEHRVRYRFQSIFPLYNIDPQLRHWFLSANNEVMLNLNKGYGSIFDRNRLYAGFGYQVNPKLNFQLGYLNQFAYLAKNDKKIVDHLIQFSVSYNMDDIMGAIFK